MVHNLTILYRRVIKDGKWKAKVKENKEEKIERMPQRHITACIRCVAFGSLGSKNRSRHLVPWYGFVIARFWAPAKIIGSKNGLPLFLLIQRPKPRKQPER